MQKFLFATVLTTGLVAAQPPATGLDVGAGSRIDFGNAAVDLDCGDLTVAGNANANGANLTSLSTLAIAAGGTLAGGSSHIALGVDFANAGTFAPGTGQISIGEICGYGTSRITGSNAFYDLLVTSGMGKILAFPAGATQNVAHALTLQGDPSSLLQVVSSTPGTQAKLVLATGAAQTIAYVNARDNDARGGATIAPGAASNYHSVDGGNLLNWFGSVIGGTNGGAVPAPALGRWTALLLATLLAAFALKRRRTS